VQEACLTDAAGPEHGDEARAGGEPRLDRSDVVLATDEAAAKRR
jgi:hypothetical protein